jgi:hypothetical protein
MHARGTHCLVTGHVVGEDPPAPLSPNARAQLLRSDGFEHVADIVGGSFYDPELEQARAFEELISFHGRLGGPPKRPFLLHSVRLPGHAGSSVGAAQVHAVLSDWRRLLRGNPVAEAARAAP